MRSNLLLATVALMVALASPARATVVLPGDLGDIARGAAVIVRGTVVGVRADWADGGRRRVATVVTLAVSETLKGGMAGRVSFQVPGGVVGRYRSVTIGAPTFRVGEEVIVCLGAKPPALPYVLGLNQGVFRVKRDTATGQRVVSGPVLLADGQRTATVQRGDPTRRPMSVEQFTATVRTVLSATRPPRSPVPPGSKRGLPQ
jgi:hypothetical protein